MYDTQYLNIKLIPYTDYLSIKPMGNSNDTIVDLFEQNFFCKEEMKNGCFILQEGLYVPFIFPKQMLWYIASEIDLTEIHSSFKNMTNYKPVIVQDWRTETWLIIEFEWEINKNCTNIVLTYTNYPLGISFGRWKTEALKFLTLLSKQDTPMFHDVSNYTHFI